MLRKLTIAVAQSLLIIFVLSSCSNPLGGGEDNSDITDGHNPLDPVDNTLGTFTLSGAITSSTSANISWTNSTNADAYKLEYGTTSGIYTTTLAGATSPTPVTGLVSGTNYYFLVTASNEDGELASNEIAVGTIGTFSITGVTSQQGGATLFWANATGSTNYKVSYGTSSGAYPTVASNNATSPFAITGLTPGTTYYFKVEASNSSTTQLSSNEISAIPLGAFTMAAVAGDESANITWTGSAGATSYTLKYGTATGVYGTTVTTSATSPTNVTGLTAGTTYYFMVEANNSTGSNNASAEKTAIPLKDFVISSAVAGKESATITWASSAGSTSYNLRYGTASGNYTTTVSSVTSPLTVSALTAGTTYYFMIDAINSTGTTSATSEASAIPLNEFTMTAAAGITSATITWGNSTGATAYTLKYGTTSGLYGTLVSANATSPANITGLVAGTTYYFMVESRNATGALNATSEVTATPMSAFTMSGVGGNALANISWTASTGATSYTLKYGSATGVYGTTHSTSATSPMSVGSLVNGQTYYFMVEAKNSSGTVTATAESAVVVGEISVPQNFTLTGRGGEKISPVLSWTAPTLTGSGLSYYEVAIGTTSGGTNILNWSIVPGGSSVTSYTIQDAVDSFSLNLNYETSYYVSLRAVDSSAQYSTAVVNDWQITWTPRAFGSNLKFWFDGGDASTVTVNGSNQASEWRDKSANGFVFNQTTPADKPTYANFLNHKGFDFNTLSKKFLLSTSTVIVDTDGFAAFFVAQQPVAGNWRSLLSAFNARTFALYAASSGTAYRYYNGVHTSTTLQSGAAQVLGYVATPGSNFIDRRDGTEISSSLIAATTFTSSGFALGNYVSPNQTGTSSATIGEVVLLEKNDVLLSWQKIEGYLAHKWGLQANLPVGHPYKTSAP